MSGPEQDLCDKLFWVLSAGDFLNTSRLSDLSRIDKFFHNPKVLARENVVLAIKARFTILGISLQSS